MSDLFGSHSDSYGHCCPPVFDPYTLVALLGGIALATYFLRLVIVTTTFTGRSLGFESFLGSFNILGKLTDDPSWMTNILEEILQTYEEVNNEREESSSSNTSISAVDTVTSDYENPITNTTNGRGFCRSEVWHCMSGVLEGGIRYVEKPEDIYSGFGPVLYKAVFHGGVKSMWSSVMEVPSMRRMGECINDHDKCVEHSILLSEVNNYLESR